MQYSYGEVAQYGMCQSVLVLVDGGHVTQILPDTDNFIVPSMHVEPPAIVVTQESDTGSVHDGAAIPFHRRPDGAYSELGTRTGDVGKEALSDSPPAYTP